ncbi:MAG: hypothetical protein MZV64_28545 [Ignavibacteriales bacterium]|nr:hypothetical protein [Ignavibacteriales bacterium]
MAAVVSRGVPLHCVQARLHIPVRQRSNDLAQHVVDPDGHGGRFRNIERDLRRWIERVRIVLQQSRLSRVESPVDQVLVPIGPAQRAYRSFNSANIEWSAWYSFFAAWLPLVDPS